MEESRKGRQEPTVWSILPYEKTLADEAVALYAESDQELMPWQVKQLEAIMAVDQKGGYVHRRYGLSISRRNGKTELYIARELYALFAGERVMHTAHLATTAEDAAMRLAETLHRMGYEEVVRPVKGETYDHHFKFLKQRGAQTITLMQEGSGIITFRTRTARGALGTKCDILIADEAQEFTNEHQNTLQYLISDSKNRQLLYCGTPPTAVSMGTVFKAFREQVLEGKAKYSGWAEWSTPEKADPYDKDLWYECNPSLGYVFDEEAVELEINADVLDFNIQRLGFWVNYNLKSAITEAEWQKTEVGKAPKLKGKTFVGIKIGNQYVSMSIACKTQDDQIYVSLIGSKPTREGLDWMVEFVQKIPSLNKICVDGKGTDQLMADKLKAVGLKKPTIPNGADFIRSTALFEQAVFNGGILHSPQPVLDKVVTNCEKKTYGNRGSFIFVPCSDAIDITPLESAMLAYWLAYTTRELGGQKVGY